MHSSEIFKINNIVFFVKHYNNKVSDKCDEWFSTNELQNHAKSRTEATFLIESHNYIAIAARSLP